MLPSSNRQRYNRFRSVTFAAPVDSALARTRKGHESVTSAGGVAPARGVAASRRVRSAGRVCASRGVAAARAVTAHRRRVGPRPAGHIRSRCAGIRSGSAGVRSRCARAGTDGVRPSRARPWFRTWAARPRRPRPLSTWAIRPWAARIVTAGSARIVPARVSGLAGSARPTGFPRSSRSTRAPGHVSSGATRLVPAGTTGLVTSRPVAAMPTAWAARLTWSTRSAPGPPGPTARSAGSTRSRTARSAGSAWSRTARSTGLTDHRWRPVDDGWSVVDDRGSDRVAVANVPIPIRSPRRVPEVARAPVRSGLRVGVGDAAQSTSCGHRCRCDDTACKLVHGLCVPDQAMRAPSGPCRPDETPAAPLGSRLAGRAPKEVTALQFGCANGSSAHPARFAGAAIDIAAWPAPTVRRWTVIVFGAHCDDLAAA